MNLYSQKEANIRKTWFLVGIFLVAVIGIAWFFSYVYDSPAILYIAVIFSILMNFLAYWHSDKIVLRLARAREVGKEEASELYRVVENLAITAGLPTPKIYLIDEEAPNAFATGRNPEHAVVAVTSGLLKKLDRSELEGVVAHELSHIGNRDMLLSTVIVVLVGFVSILADIFIRSVIWGGMRSDNDNDRSRGIFILIGIAFSILAPIALGLMQLAISRKREFLADSSGALLTRYPEGLARALEKISADRTPMRAAINATSHLWVSDPFKNKRKKTPWLHKLFMTHPPIEERVKALRGLKI